MKPALFEDMKFLPQVICNVLNVCQKNETSVLGFNLIILHAIASNFTLYVLVFIL